MAGEVLQLGSHSEWHFAERHSHRVKAKSDRHQTSGPASADNCPERRHYRLHLGLREVSTRKFLAGEGGSAGSDWNKANEAFLKLARKNLVEWQGKTHFFAVGANIIRRVLVEHARSKQRLKHGGGRQRIALHRNTQIVAGKDEDLLAVDEAIEKLRSRNAQPLKTSDGAAVSEEDVLETVANQPAEIMLFDLAWQLRQANA